MARHNVSGWYADVPSDLKREFESKFPGRANKRKLTIAFIKWALRVKPPFLKPPQESRPIR